MGQQLHVLLAGAPEGALTRLGRLFGGANPALHVHSVSDHASFAEAVESRQWDLVAAGEETPDLDAPRLLRILEQSGRRIPFLQLAAGENDPVQAAFRSLARQDNVGVILADAEGRHLEANPAAERMLGCGPGELIGLSYRDITPEWEPDFGRAGCRAALQTGFSRGCHWIRRRDGSLMSAILRGVRVAPERILVLLQDLDHEADAVRDLLTSDVRFRSYIEHAPVATFVADSLGRYVDCNPAATGLLGYSREQLLRLSVAECVAPEDREIAGTEFLGLLQHGRLDADYRMLRCDGSVIWISLHAVTVPGGLAIAYCRDITGEKQTEAALRESEEHFRTLFESFPLPVLELDVSGLVEGLGQLDAESGWDGSRLVASRPAAVRDLASRVILRAHNPAAASLAGAGVAEPLSAVLPEASLGDFLGAVRSLRNGQSHAELETRIRDAAGQLRDWIVTFSVAAGHRGELSRLFATAQDITERKRAEQDLRDREAKYRAVIESSADGFWMLDPEGIIREVNDAYLRRSGYSREELLGHHVSEFDTLLDDRLVRGKIAQLAAGITDLSETRHRARDGTEWLVEVNASFSPVEGGRCLAFLRDICRRKRSETLLRLRFLLSDVARRGGLSEVLQAVTDEAEGLTGSGSALFLLGTGDAPGTCVWSSRSTLSFPHGQQSATRTAVWTSCIHYDRPLVENAANPAERTLAVPVRRNGALVAVLAVGRKPSGYTLEDVEVMTEIAALAMDVVERKQAEDGLRESQEQLDTERRHAHMKLERFVAASPAVLYALDVRADGVRFAWCSENLVDITGYRPAEVSQEWWLDGLHRDDRERVLSANTLPYPDDRCSLEFRFRRKDGGWAWIRDERRLIRNAAGQPVEVVGSWFDITARVELEQQLRQSQKLEAIGSFAGSVAHDFNNLLTVINGYTQMMISMVDAADPLRPSLDEVRRAGERAAALTRQLMTFGRKQAPAPQLLSLNRVIGELQSMLGRVVGEEIGLCIFANAVHDTLWADRQQIEQVIVNLALNARDALPSGGILTLETSEESVGNGRSRAPAGAQPGRYVVLDVMDTGVGMTAEVQARIFEPFYTTKPADRGAGLGLSTVQGIVAQNHGFIEVVSRPGEGSTFRVFLPGAGREPSPEPSPRQPAADHTGTVLLVEDQEQPRQFATLSLRKLGYPVVTAATAEDALRIGRNQETALDAALIDVVMPGMSGPELARTLLALRPRLKILFMSGGDGDSAHPAFPVEPLAVLKKPFTPEQLGARLREVLGAARRPARILIVDDEAGVRKFLKLVLEKAGFDVCEAPDGVQAVKAVDREPVDILVTDLIMPDQEGIETIRKIRKDKPDIRIIAMSGKPDYLRIAQTLGADSILEKPVSPDKLVALVRDLLDR
jgi:two-component system, cell cycle sensor histidine kinase and response regulator CckA